MSSRGPRRFPSTLRLSRFALRQLIPDALGSGMHAGSDEAISAGEIANR